MTTTKRFKCRFCGAVFPAWSPVFKQPNGAMLHHLGQDHRDRVGLYLDRMHRTEDIDRVVVEADEVLED